MAAFNVTALLDLGYPETAFRDPMEARWRAEAVTPAKFTPTAITTKVQFMASLEPYNNVEEVFEVLDEYWDTHTPPKHKRSAAPTPAPAAAAPADGKVHRRMRIEGNKIKQV